MKFIQLFIVLTFFKVGTSLHLREMSEITDHVKPYQVVICTDNFVKDKVQDFFISKIIDRTPSMILNFSDMKKSHDNRSLSMPVFQNPRKSAIYIIYFIMYGEIEEKIFKILDEFVKTSPVPSRPKCLLILSCKNINWLFEDVLKKVLDYAWNLKFLDFTVLHFDKDNETICTNFNPFTKDYDSRYLKNISELFPDKLNDVKNYPLIMPVFNDEPYIMVQSTGNDVVLKGASVGYIKIILEKMNFKHRYVMLQYNEYQELFENLTMKLENNEINLIPQDYMMNPYLYKRNLIIGTRVSIGHMVAVVPIKKVSRLFFSYGVLLYTLSFPVIMTIFYSLVKILKFDSTKWNIFYIFQVLIGVTTFPPQKQTQKFVFLLVGLLSVMYSTEFFSKFTDMKVLSEDKNFDTLEAILESKISIFSIYTGYESDPVIMKNLFSKVKPVNKSKDCINKLIESRSAICIASGVKAKYFAEFNLDQDMKPIMKISSMSLNAEFTAFPYERASPFAEKFDEIIQQITESGIIGRKKLKNQVNIRRYSKKISKEKKDILFDQLVVISIIGYFLAMMVFLLEIGGKSIIKKIRMIHFIVKN